MENKLEQLTRKLYEEGLAKGRTDGEKMVAEAEAQAKKILAEARAEAAEIVQKAKTESEDLRKNTLTEISLAGKQAVAKIKDEIAGAIIAKSVTGELHKANLDADFVKRMLLAVAGNWNSADSGKISLSALLPAERQNELDKVFAKSTKELLDAGIEVGYSKNVRTGFKVGAKGGGYYISFSDDDFDALLGAYLREKVTKLLYSNQE